MTNRTVPAAAKGMPTASIASLSFVAKRDGKALPKPTPGQLPRCFWHAVPTGDDYADEKAGVRLALEYLAFEAEAAKATHYCPILALIISDMPKPLGPIETAFLSLIGFGLRGAFPFSSAVASHWNRSEGRA